DWVVRPEPRQSRAIAELDPIDPGPTNDEERQVPPLLDLGCRHDEHELRGFVPAALLGPLGGEVVVAGIAPQVSRNLHEPPPAALALCGNGVPRRFRTTHKPRTIP